MEKTERESDNRKEMADCWCCQDQQRACRMAQALAEKLEHTGPAEKSGLSATERAVGKNARAALAKRKSRLSRVPDHEGGESQGGREHGEVRVDSTVNKGRFQGGKDG